MSEINRNFDPSKLNVGGDDGALAEPPVEDPEESTPDGSEDPDGSGGDPTKDGDGSSDVDDNEDGEPTAEPGEGDDPPEGDEEGGGPSGSEDGSVTEEDINSYLQENYNIGISGVEKLQRDNQSLREQLDNKVIEFPNEQAKKIFEYATKFSGMELSAAKNYIHIQSLAGSLESLSDKEKQFEAFALERTDLPRDKARRIFNERYERQFGNLQEDEDDVVLKDDHDIATKRAEDKIREMHAEFERAKSEQSGNDNASSKEDLENFSQNVVSATEDFGGIEIQFGKDNSLNFSLPEGKKEEFLEILSDPNKFYQTITADCIDQEGNFDYKQFAIEMFEIVYRKDLFKEVDMNGFNRGQKRIIKDKLKNANPAVQEQLPQNNKPSFVQAFTKALADSKTS